MYSPSQSSNSSVLAELYKYNPSSIIELYELSLSPLSDYYASKGTPISTQVYRFHNGYNEKYGTISPNVVWDGNSYSGRPVQMEGIQASSSGEVARPTFVVANHDWTFTQFNKAYANLVGAKIRRIRTLVKFLDSENFKTRNLCVNSQDFDTWLQATAADTDVIANAITAPDGTLTADKIYEATATSAQHSIYKTISTIADNATLCFSVYLKAGERQYATLLGQSKASSTGGSCGKTFDLLNGTVIGTTRNAAIGPSVLSSGIAPVGNGWYRCWMVFSAQSGSPDRSCVFQINIDNDSNPAAVTYAGVSPTNGNTITTGIYAWGAQVEVVSNPTLTPTTYQVTGATLGNPTADPNAKFPDDVYVIDRMSEDIPGQITYELAPAWDVEGVQLPRRQVVANICPWVYKTDPCNWAYSGAVSVSYVSGTSGSTVSLTSAVISPYSDVLIVNGVSGTIKTGMTVTGGSTLANTKIVSQTSGTTGGVGQYKLNKPQSFLNVSPTTVTPVGVYTSVPVKSTTKSGSGALLKVTIASPSAPYSGATIAVTNPGKNYNISPPTEQLTIDGSYLGGDSVTNDLVVNLASVNNSFYDENDIIVSTASQDRCGKRLTSCRIRFGSRALPFGGFPSAGLYGKPI